MAKFALNSWQGWREYCDSPQAIRPERISRQQHANLSPSERTRYDAARHHYHAHIPPIRHSELVRIHDLLDMIRYTNPVDGYAARNALVIDGEPTLGKTTTVVSYARHLDKSIRKEKGDRTETGRHRVPVVRVGLSGNPSMKDLSVAFAHFLAVPDGGGRATRERLTSAIIDELSLVETELVIFDDIHCVSARTRDGAGLADQFKRMADDIAGTCVFVGVDLANRGFYEERPTATSSRLAQTSRRWTLARPERFSITTPSQRQEWGQLVRALAEKFVLLNSDAGLDDSDIELAYERTGGSIGSLMQLLTRSAFLAIKSGDERITTQRLRDVEIDLAAHVGQPDREGEVKAVRQRLRSKSKTS